MNTIVYGGKPFPFSKYKVVMNSPTELFSYDNINYFCLALFHMFDLLIGDEYLYREKYLEGGILLSHSEHGSVLRIHITKVANRCDQFILCLCSIFVLRCFCRGKVMWVDAGKCFVYNEPGMGMQSLAHGFRR